MWPPRPQLTWNDGNPALPTSSTCVFQIFTENSYVHERDFGGFLYTSRVVLKLISLKMQWIILNGLKAVGLIPVTGYLELRTDGWIFVHYWKLECVSTSVKSQIFIFFKLWEGEEDENYT